jgi:hypothetical protein
LNELILTDKIYEIRHKYNKLFEQLSAIFVLAFIHVSIGFLHSLLIALHDIATLEYLDGTSSVEIFQIFEQYIVGIKATGQGG